MGNLDAFLSSYQRDTLDDRVLPAALSQYSLLSCLKSGEERHVFLLQDEDKGRYILKLQPAGREDALFLEYERLKGINHPQFPKAISCFTENDTDYLLREYVEGVSLYDLVTQEEPMGEAACIAVGISVCAALRVLQELAVPIVHRDIKPQNIILSPDGTCHLIDLGTARLYKKDGRMDTVFMGTRATAAPEQFGFRQTDIRADVYGLGMLLRFLRTGMFEPLRRKDASWGFRCMVSCCTAFDPKRRFQTADSLIRALRLLQQKKKAGAVLLSFIAVLAAVVLLLSFGRDDSVHFESVLVEQAVRQELGLSSGEAIPRDRLGEVTELIICGQMIMDDWQEHEEEKWDRHDPFKRRLYGGISMI